MIELLPTINKIVKYGLEPNLQDVDKKKSLEKNLIKIYSLYFDINYIFDNADYEDFNKLNFRYIKQNIESNFSDFGLYKTVIDRKDINNISGFGVGDAIDDLSDIILDLLEIKWRIENNSLMDGLWYFEHVFSHHTQSHILDLLSYMKKNKE